jgi:hypothetical protein
MLFHAPKLKKTPWGSMVVVADLLRRAIAARDAARTSGAYNA